MDRFPSFRNLEGIRPPSPTPQQPLLSATTAASSNVAAATAVPTTTTPPAASASVTTTVSAPSLTAQKIPFHMMCQIFERIGQAKTTKAQQLGYLERLWKDMRGAIASDYYQVLRLVMPQLDAKRSVYGLKESKIARFYVELLGLSDTSPDAIRFKHWKDPSRSSVDTTAFSDAVFVMLSKRGFGSGVGGGSDASSVGMSIKEVNQALDALAATQNQNDKKSVLFQLLRKMSAIEHKWLIRIIMKEMKIHLSHGPILAAFHPNALELFNSTNDLAHVCDKCLDPKALEELSKAAAGGALVYLMRPFKPMLASVVASDKLQTLLEGEKLIVEPKYDGERILLHFDANPTTSAITSACAPPRIMYWSRNAKNSSHLYAPKFDPVIKSCITWEGLTGAAAHPNMFVVKNCVLDGELLLYDKEKRQFVDFGHNRTFARERGGGGADGPSSLLQSAGVVKKDTLAGGSGGEDYAAPFFNGGIQNFDPNRYCFQYQVFDVVFLNGECLCSTPLDKRKETLKRIIREKKDEMQLVPYTYIKTGKEILQSLDRALAEKHEGILIKVAGSHYVPAERKLKWMKLKPDHVSGMADTLDLIILGAYFGTKYGQRGLSHFLLGSYVDDAQSGTVTGAPSMAGNLLQVTNTSNPRPATIIGVKRERVDDDQGHIITMAQPQAKFNFADRKALFHTVCKVGTGYSEAELRELNTTLEGKWITLPPGSPAPPWLDGWKPGSGEVPDVYIHPKDSAVLEIFGFSFNDTTKFKFGSTIRFPRCNRIRHDKDVEDATTTSQLKLISAAGTTLLSTRKAGDLDALITMREAKKTRKEGGVNGIGQDRAKKNLKGEGDGFEAGAPRKTLVFASRSIVAPQAGTVEMKSELFAGYEMCVLQCSIEIMERTALERLLVAHGAQVVSNPQPKTSVILATSRNHIRVQNWIEACTNLPADAKTSIPSVDGARLGTGDMAAKYNTTDIVNVSWALDCIAHHALLPLVPSNTIYASPSLQLKFRQMLDPYHDPYYREASREELRASIAAVIRKGHHKKQAASGHDWPDEVTARPLLPQPKTQSVGHPSLSPAINEVFGLSKRIALLKASIRKEFECDTVDDESDNSALETNAISNALLQFQPATTVVATVAEQRLQCPADAVAFAAGSGQENDQLSAFLEPRRLGQLLYSLSTGAISL